MHKINRELVILHRRDFSLNLKNLQYQGDEAQYRWQNFHFDVFHLAIYVSIPVMLKTDNIGTIPFDCSICSTNMTTFSSNIMNM